MPSISETPDRHVVIDRRPGHYLCFPDVCLAPDGRLLAVYNEFNQHVGTRRRILLKSSADLGRTWSAPRMISADKGHCPRLSLLSDDQLVLSDDGGPTLHWSTDSGEHWAPQQLIGVVHGLLDRVLELDTETLLTTGHAHRGSAPQPKIRQAPAEQMLYRSENRGRSFTPYSVIANDSCLVLCEASLLRLPDGVLLALMRENSYVYEPMYLARSADNGATWSAPAPTPLIGHRPTLGLTAAGRLLATYRCVGPNLSTSAWMGSLEDLADDFAVHGLAPDPDNPTLTEEGLRIRNASGPDAPARYALRPLTDPARAVAELEAQVLCREAEEAACGLRFGIWWKIYPDRVVPDLPDAESTPLTPGKFQTLRLVYAAGRCSLMVNGEPRLEVPIAATADARPVVFGTRDPGKDNGGEHVWRRLKLRILEQRYERDFLWTWHAAWGLPDAWVRAHVLELKNDRLAQPPDLGYSGWCQLPDGRYFCAFHHGGGDEDGYTPGRSAHVRGAWFEDADFGF